MADPDIDQKISDDLGVDVAAVERQVQFRLDHARMLRGEPGQLGYVLMDRDRHADAAVVFATPHEANAAIQDHPLIDSLAEEDCLDCYVPDRVGIDDLKGREIILP